MAAGFTLIGEYQYDEISDGTTESITVPSHDGKASLLVCVHESHSGGSDNTTAVIYNGTDMCGKPSVASGSYRRASIHVLMNPDIGTYDLEYEVTGTPVNTLVMVYLVTNVIGHTAPQTASGEDRSVWRREGDTMLVIGSNDNATMSSTYTELYDEAHDDGNPCCYAAYEVADADDDDQETLTITNSESTATVSFFDKTVGGVRIVDRDVNEGSTAQSGLIVPSGLPETVYMVCITMSTRGTSELSAVSWESGSAALTKVETIGGASDQAITVWELTSPAVSPREGDYELQFSGTNLVTVKMTYVLANISASSAADANEGEGDNSNDQDVTMKNGATENDMAFGCYGHQTTSGCTVESGWGYKEEDGTAGSQTIKLITMYKFSDTANDVCTISGRDTEKFCWGGWAYTGNPALTDVGVLSASTFIF